MQGKIQESLRHEHTHKNTSTYKGELSETQPHLTATKDLSRQHTQV